MEDKIIVICPHCEEFVFIEQLNCCIFRHAVFIASGEPIDPHATEIMCTQYVKNQLVYGCGKPFKIEKKEDVFIAVKCNYI
jgi:hypothetical protein